MKCSHLSVLHSTCLPFWIHAGECWKQLRYIKPKTCQPLTCVEMRKMYICFSDIKGKKHGEARFLGGGARIPSWGWLDEMPQGFPSTNFLHSQITNVVPQKTLESPFVKWDSLKQIPVMQTRTSSQLLLDWILDNQICSSSRGMVFSHPPFAEGCLFQPQTQKEP